MKWRTDSGIHHWLPRLQAHRGYWVEGLQQNSLKSIQKAFEMKYEMAEFDVRLTKDKVVVLFHDNHYQGIPIAKMNYEEFKLKAAVDFPDIVTLEHVLSWFSQLKNQKPQPQFKLNIEIKSNKIFNAILEVETMKLIQKFGMSSWILISSFNPFSLYRFKKMDPAIYRALLVTHDKESNFILNKMWLNFLCVPDVLHLRRLDFELKKYAKLEVPIVLWTVNAMTEVENFKYKIFGVISDQITPKHF